MTLYLLFIVDPIAYLCHKWLYVPLTNDISPSCTTYALQFVLDYSLEW